MSGLRELLRKKKQSIEAASGRRGKTEKLPNGQSKWRILPSWRGAGEYQFWHDFGQHFVKDEAGDLKAVYVCVSKTYTRDCPICEMIEAAWDATDDDGRAILKESIARGRVLVNAIRVDGDGDDSPVILELPPTVFEKVCDIGLLDDYGDDFITLDKGVDITFTRSGKGMNTEYSVNAARKSRAIDPSVMKRIANLDDYVAQEYDEAKQKALASLKRTAGALPGVAGAVALSHGTSSDADDYEDDDIPFDAGHTYEGESVAVATDEGDDELDELVSLAESEDVVDDVTAKPEEEAKPAKKKVVEEVAEEDDFDDLLAEFDDL